MGRPKKIVIPDDAPIKTKDICERCVNDFYGDKCGNAKKCEGCDMVIEKVPKCKCLTIKYMTPCPYFTDKEKTEGD